MQRVTDAMITRRIARLQKEGCDVGIDGQYGRFRVTNKSGSRDLSPRVPNRQILDWLDAFEQGWDAYKRVVGKEASDMIAAGEVHSGAASFVEDLAHAFTPVRG